MRALILADAGDATAGHVAGALHSRSTGSHAELVWMSDVVRSPRFVHTLDDDGVTTRVTLRDGREIVADDFDVVFNRARVVALPPPFVRSRPADREYAIVEWTALMTSWLASFACPVVNPVSPPCLSGVMRHPSEWYRRAGEAALRTLRAQASSSPRRFGRAGLQPVDADAPREPAAAAAFAALNRPGWFQEEKSGRCCDVLVAGDETLGPLSAGLQQRINQVARSDGLLLARCWLFESAAGGEDWMFGAVDPWPELTDRPSIDAVVRLLERSARS
jgi:hypothetical protein